MREPIQNSGTGVSPVHPVPEADWEKLRPVLDQAMHELKETDREAVLLRYFENQQFAELGAKLGLNENAARMRVERALEKLRTIFAKRGITTATALSSVISANAVQLAPANLAATLTTASVASAGTGTFTLLKIMTATRLKLGVSALVVAGAATALVVQHQTQTQLRAENDSLRQQIAQLQTDNENLSNRLNSASAPPSLPDNQLNELLRLRSEVGTLRRQTNEIERLKMEVRAATQNPNRQNDSQPDPQREIARLELDHIHQLTLGVVTFANDHQGQFPTDFDRIAKYLHSDELRTNLGNWEIVYRGSLTNLLDPSSIIVVRESQPLLYNGKWVKSYGFADGHCEAHEEANGNFDAWEQQRMVSPPTTQ
jgi:hypothetical protein